MFDDPKKALRQMEEALWETEEKDFEALAEEEIPQGTFSYSDDADWLEEVKEWIGEDTGSQVRDNPRQQVSRRRNDAVDFHRTVYADEKMDEASAVFVEKKKKRKGSGCLPFVIALELIGIAGVVWWWIRWLS